MLEIKNLSKQFGGINAVDSVSLEIEQGSITGLIGPNGAGKTTLFNVICGTIEPSSGSIYFRNKDITGKDLERALGNVNITVNKNAVPNDPRSPFVTSGVRLGTPAVTTRGFKTDETIQLSHWICDVIENIEDEDTLLEIKNKVIKLTKDYPVYNL